MAKKKKTAERWPQRSGSAEIGGIVPESFLSPSSFPSLARCCFPCVLCWCGVLALCEAVCVLCGVVFSLVVVEHSRRSVLPHFLLFLALIMSVNGDRKPLDRK